MQKLTPPKPVLSLTHKYIKISFPIKALVMRQLLPEK
jgi:hypothetical protein